MAYDPTVPDQANLVRTASGDLALMQGNFQALAPVYSGLAISGVEPSAAIRGFYFGDPTNHKRFFVQSDGNDLFSVQRNLSGETSPDWQTAMYLSQVSGEEVCFTVPVSGVTPTSGFHFATKDYVDTNPTFSGLADTTITSPTSGQISVWNGSAWANADHVHTLNSLTDVSVVSPASGEVLIFNGSQWGPDELYLTTTLASLTDTDVSSPVSGQTLEFDGTNWVNVSPPVGNRVICVLSGAQTQTIPQSAYTTFSGNEVPLNLGGFSVNSGIVTIPAGIERVDVMAQANWASSSSDTNYELEIKLNGAALSSLSGYNISAKDRRRKPTTADVSSQNTIAFDVPVASGDEITAVLYQDGVGAGLNIVGGAGLLVREATNGGTGGGGGGGGSETLSGLTDTNVDAVISGQSLTYDGSEWVPSYITLSGVVGRKLVSGTNTVGLWLFDGDLTDETALGTDLDQNSSFDAAPAGNGLRGAWISDSIIYDAAVVSGLQFIGDVTMHTIFTMHALPDTADRMAVIMRCGSSGEDEVDNILYSMGVTDAGQLVYFSEHDSGADDITYAGYDSTVVPGTTHLLSMVRNSNNIYFYLDGYQVGTASGISAPTGGGNSVMRLGGTSFGSASYLATVACAKLVSGAQSAADVLAEFESTWKRGAIL